MMIPYSEREKPKSYSSFKKEYFEKTKVKVHSMINNIKYSSLKDEDKAKLIDNIRKQLDQ